MKKILISKEEYHYTQVVEFINKFNIEKEDLISIHESYREKQLRFTIFFWGTEEMKLKVDAKTKKEKGY
jgi:hypothetical protein